MSYSDELSSLNRKSVHTSQTISIPHYVDANIDIDYSWIEIRGTTDYLQGKPLQQSAKLMEQLLTSVGSVLPILNSDCSIALRIGFIENHIQLSLGCPCELIEVLESSLRALYPGIHTCQNHEPAFRSIFRNSPTYSGCLIGYPSLAQADSQNECNELPLDQFLRGVHHIPFYFVVSAQLMRNKHLQGRQSFIQDKIPEAAYKAERVTTNNDSSSQTIVNHAAKQYLESLEKYEDLCKYAQSSALWAVTVTYASTSEIYTNNLGGLLCAALNGNSYEVPEPITNHSISNNSQQNDNDIFAFNNLPYCTYMSTRELARYFALPREEYAGYYVDQYVSFDVDNRPGRRSNGDYHLGSIVRSCQENSPVEGTYSIDLDDLTRHALIIGLTGGGKTNTSKSLLRQLWSEHKIPFLVIESAKREYWELYNLTDNNGWPVFPQNNLNVFTVGDENPATSSPFRLNPMEAEPGSSLQTHINNLLATFYASFELYAPMPYVLERAVYKVYEDRGWDIVTGENKFGLNRYPMLEELKDAIIEVTDSLKYDAEVASNVKAALTARITSLMVGGKEFIMNTPQSISMDYLLKTPTVLELEDLGDDDTKAFVMGILLVRIYEYRQQKQYETSNRIGGGKSLQHIIMIEEAHRLLKNVQSNGEGNQTRAKAVEFFCNMLAEIRSFGQGFFIADQVPTKLAPDTLKNTNLKIIHRTVMQEDREAVGRAMNMRDDQISYLSALRVGCAAVFSEGDNRPKLIRFPLQLNKGNLTRQEAIRHCRERINSECSSVFVKSDNTPACYWCAHPCEYSKQANELLKGLNGAGCILSTLDKIGNIREISAWNAYFSMFPISDDFSLKLCFIGKVIHRNSLMTSAENKKLLRDFVVQNTDKSK
ncbi:MAG: ATP-binding protein [Clostridiales bacterium]|nr:ATP-binding protein [Clostridiales bacterium]